MKIIGKEAKIEHIIVDLSTDRSGRLVKFFNNECQIASYPEVSQIGLLKKMMTNIIICNLLMV